MEFGAHRIRGETLGAFIDAIYAIAVTILALEIPSTLPDGAFSFEAFADVLIEYAVSFMLLFTFWLQHRRINGLAEEVGRAGFWANAVILMLVCLVPRATTLVFEFGDDVTLAGLLRGSQWTTAEAVDLLYVLVVVCIDLGILGLLRINRGRASGDHLRRLQRSKTTTSILLILVVSASFLLPVENRFFLLVIPAVLFFEKELSPVLARFDRKPQPGPRN